MPARKRGVRVAVLVEDRRLERFARAALLEYGFHPREIRVVPGYPASGAGSGKQWVQAKYPREARLLRAKSSHQRVALLLGMDADELRVADVHARLDDSLVRAGMTARLDGEPIAHWVPRWSVETWLLHLGGDRTVTEDRSYRHDARLERLDWSASGAAYREAHRAHARGADGTALESMRISFGETDRLPLDAPV